jgi:protein-S-isoprenylcysteine O-methyltransferase Ste14
MSAPADRPGVVVLPPLLYFGALLFGAALELLRPLDLPVPAAVRWVAAFVGLAALVLAVRARATFQRAGTNVNPMQPATALVEGGPFRFTRNPMYVSMTTFYLAITVATRVAWFLVLLAPVLAVMHWGVVLREERYLSGKFGAPYDEYRRRVRRYV